MTIVERPYAAEFQQFLRHGGAVIFIVEPDDVDPAGAALSRLPIMTQINGFQIPHVPVDPIDGTARTDLFTTEKWSDIEQWVVRRGGTISYRLLYPGFFQATCLITLGGAPGLPALALKNGGDETSAATSLGTL